ncbi:MAG: RNase P modulator RnpM [Candidatus Heteroscillospira sp.]
MPKKIPMRQCTGCREMKPKRELIRVVRAPDGSISLDFRGKAPGRGAYVCRSTQCLERAIKARALERAFDTAIPAEVYAVLREQMEAGDDE